MREALVEPMLEVALKKSKAYCFPAQHQAYFFMRMCFKKALEDCGVFCPPKLPTEAERQLALNKLMIANGVKVERNRQVLLDEWWNILFIFKRGELVAFATEPKVEKPSLASSWMVRTNIKL